MGWTGNFIDWEISKKNANNEIETTNVLVREFDDREEQLEEYDRIWKIHTGKFTLGES